MEITFWIRNRDIRGSNLVSDPDYPIWRFGGIYQLTQQNISVVPGMRYRLFRPNSFQYIFFTNFPTGDAVLSEILAQSYNSLFVTTNYLGSPTFKLCVAETQIILQPLMKDKNIRLFLSNTPWSARALHISGSKASGRGTPN
jgi:hypothetical protein